MRFGGSDVIVRWADVSDIALTADSLRRDSLSAGERERLSTFRHEADRRRFVGVRRLLRKVVAEVAACLPEDVSLSQRCARCDGPHGRPAVEVGGRPGPEVTMAHAGDLALVAVGTRSLGIDVEPVTDAAATSAALVDWVRREAVLKAVGLGLDVEPDPVLLGPSGERPRLRGWAGPGDPPSLRMADLNTEPGYVAALARLGRSPLRVDAAAVVLTSS